MDFLFVTGHTPVMNRTQTGGGVRSTLLIEALSRLGHVDVISFVKEPVDSSMPNCDVIYCGVTHKGVLTLWDRFLLNIRLFFSPWRPGGYYVVDKEQESIISRYYYAKHYDFVVCHYIDDVVQCGLMRYADRLIVDADDNLVSVAKRRLANTPLHHPYSWMKAFWRTIMIGKMQSRLLKRVKLSFYSNGDEPPYEKSVFLHNVPLLSCPCSDVKESTPMRLLFVGVIDFFPNKKGILHFAESIFPIIKKRMPIVELNIVGLCNNPDIKTKLCSINGVNVLGFVEDVQEEYQNCRAVIVPLYHGSGTSIKFIEGIMMNRPVISTQMGARGFDNFFRSNQHYLLANSDQEFADHVVNVLSDLDKAKVMAREACGIAKATFSKESFFDVVKESIRNVSAG